MCPQPRVPTSFPLLQGCIWQTRDGWRSTMEPSWSAGTSSRKRSCALRSWSRTSREELRQAPGPQVRVCLSPLPCPSSVTSQPDFTWTFRTWEQGCQQQLFHVRVVMGNVDKRKTLRKAAVARLQWVNVSHYSPSSAVQGCRPGSYTSLSFCFLTHERGKRWWNGDTWRIRENNMQRPSCSQKSLNKWLTRLFCLPRKIWEHLKPVTLSFHHFSKPRELIHGRCLVPCKYRKCSPPEEHDNTSRKECLSIVRVPFIELWNNSVYSPAQSTNVLFWFHLV